VAHGFTDSLKPVEHVDCGEHMGTISQSATHSGGGLLVRAPFGKLHNRDEGEVGRSVGRLAVGRKEMGKVGIGVDRAESIAHTHIGIALGEDGQSDLRSAQGSGRTVVRAATSLHLPKWLKRGSLPRDIAMIPRSGITFTKRLAAARLLAEVRQRVASGIFTMQSLAEQIRCPTALCFAEHDEVAAYARRLYDTLTCPKQFISFTSAEGADEHCEIGNRSLFHQRVLDWLDEVFQHSKNAETK